MIPDISAALTAVQFLLASVAVGMLPGMLIVLAWRPRREFTFLELVALGIAISLTLVQALTVAALVLHQPMATLLAALGVVALAHAVLALCRGRIVVHMPRGEWLFGGSLAFIAMCLYLQGAPYASTEDAIHVAIVRRLRFLDAPALDNIYAVPRVVYTYAFPGTHYLMAAISGLADLDPLFVYHKLRAFWGFAALTLLYACARCGFESKRIALASALVATVLAANGSFAGVPNFYWGQLAPYSHASDVAMGVLLPALVLVVLHVLRAESTRVYVYTTYFEVLYTPVRNVIFFVHLSAGALLYTAAKWIARRSIAAAAGLTAATAAAMALAYTSLGRLMAQHHDLLWIPLLLGYAAGAWWLRRAASAPMECPPRPSLLV